MRIFSITQGDCRFLGFEDDGVLIDLTRAISFYEVVKENVMRPPVEHIEDLMYEEKCTLAYLSEVLTNVEKYGVRNDLALDGEYDVNPPVAPGKIIALGQNYLAHVREMGHQVPREPVLFGKWPSTVIGHEEPILKPDWIGRMDFEGELAVVIGTDAWRVPASKAMQYIAGFTCLNDVTARDLQSDHIAHSLPWMISKNFETFSPIGPCLLVREAVEEPIAIQVQSRVNGKLLQDGNTGDFIFDIPTVIEYITRRMKLEAGDIISTGTPKGVGPLDPGDIVEITCEGIGTLTNPVVSLDTIEI
jgi:5-oxopent-3-ene-1,2,5-tricarboxylate decarboxylase / 2-hydroxyhepta-2,4-diene-1,7-dioate isomerase